ncbi:peptidoglycan-binding protein [Streptomyces sp. NBC_00249]|uniref:peptidoglycan-binding domain-containing protein n=1 Tax=Streptomyces sp. NBC_00249 TaxID=2975690 RepID=UPI002259645D|nr:peptidoglycan-binding domain-containing protein [Streptomyces sp. NBC_00249]MCX5195146.1 peptidoglycan-binding protein [Streptomyces sp. NBC_00249]
MSPEPEEPGTTPDDRLLVRPYVTPSGRTSASTAPAWPLGPDLPVPVPAPTSGTPSAPAASAAPRDRRAPRRRSRLPLAALVLLALAGAGALVFLPGGTDPEPATAAPHPGLSLPALPARIPGAGESSEAARPSTTPSGPSASASASRSASAPPSPTPAATTAKPSPPPPKPSGTLRPGDSGPAVRQLQERLYGQGFTYVSSTGVYDKHTERGVAQLQRDRDIKGDPRGVYGPATQAAFG